MWETHGSMFLLQTNLKKMIYSSEIEFKVINKVTTVRQH